MLIRGYISSPSSLSMRKTLYIILALLLLLVVLVIFSSRLFLPQLLSFYFSKQFKAEVKIDKARLSLKDGIVARGISISNKRGLRCSVESAVIGTVPLSTIVRTNKGTVPIIFKLKNIELSYPESAVVSSIAKALSLKQPELFRFDTVGGRFYFRGREFIFKALTASGEYIRLFINGTITDGSRIEAVFRILLSGKLVESIPEATRKVFFKQDGPWSKVELYLSGDIRRPSINFSTDLFKLIVR